VFGAFVFINGRVVVVVADVMRCPVPTEVRMHARGAMVVVVAVVQVRVDERRPERPKL